MISTYITCFNKGEYIGEAIQSILNQTLQPEEIIIVDDRSTDCSRDIITHYAKQYPSLIKPIFNIKNLGIVKCRNIALRNCSGDLITFLDGDDYFYQEKLESEYNILIKSDAHAVYSNFHYINKKGHIIGKFAEENDTPAEGNIFINTFGRIYNTSSGNNYIYEMFYRNCLNEVGYYDPKIKLWEDWDFRIRFSQKFRYIFCPQINMIYRKHSEGISNLHPSEHYYYQKKVFNNNKHYLDTIPTREKRFVYMRVKNKLEALLNIMMRDALYENNMMRAFFYWLRLFSFFNRKKYLLFIIQKLLTEKSYQKVIQLKNRITSN